MKSYEPLSQQDPAELKEKIPIAERLEDKQAHDRFVGLEIEAKLQMADTDLSSEAVLLSLKKTLEAAGCEFDSSEIETRDLYVIYYKKRKKKRGKIIAKNQGRNGFQVKCKSDGAEDDAEGITVKEETLSEVFVTLQEAEHYLAEQIGLERPEQHVTSVISIKKYKLLFSALGEEGIKRFFRLVVDEARVPDNAEVPLLRQIELEYKGTQGNTTDQIETVRDQLQHIAEFIRSKSDIPIADSQSSKREWSLGEAKK